MFLARADHRSKTGPDPPRHRPKLPKNQDQDRDRMCSVSVRSGPRRQNGRFLDRPGPDRDQNKEKLETETGPLVLLSCRNCPFTQPYFWHM